MADTLVPGPVFPTFGAKQNVRFLNAYTCFYPSDDGDIPIQVVAGNIVEAGKIACLPGMVAAESVEPVQIKYAKSKVGTAIPVRMVSFTTVIEPRDAQLAGAIIAPSHFDVDNGAKVIFTASEPFGFKFEGWYKEGFDAAISTDRVAEIEVYEQHKSFTKFIAKYTSNPSLRSGRYLDIQASNNSARASIWDIDFDPIANYVGRIVLNADDVTAYYGAISEIDHADRTISIVPDGTLGGTPTDFRFTVHYDFTPIGLCLDVVKCDADNLFRYEVGDIIQLKWLY